MGKRPPASAATNGIIRTLLDKYKCPTPFHQVRTRFLGSIVSPMTVSSPMVMVERIWGGKLPVLKSAEETNELLGGVVMGLWNQLKQRQERQQPFRLTRSEVESGGKGLAKLAVTRVEELDGFVEGLLGGLDSVPLPKRAAQGLDALGRTRAMFVAVIDIAADPAKSGSVKELKAALRNMREMTTFAEEEIHAVVVTCAQARRADTPPAGQPPVGA